MYLQQSASNISTGDALRYALEVKFYFRRMFAQGIQQLHLTQQSLYHRR